MISCSFVSLKKMLVTKLPNLFKTYPFYMYSTYSRTISISRWAFLKAPTTMQRSVLNLPLKIIFPTAKTTASRAYFHGKIGQRRKLLEKVFDFKVLLKRQFHPLIWVVARPLFKLIAMLTGRQFRKWWKNLPPDKRKLFSAKVRNSKVIIGAVISLLGFLALFYYLSHIQAAPMTKRERFIAFNEEQIKQMGDAVFQILREEFEELFLPANDPATRRVVSVVNRLLDANKDIEEIYNKEWTIAVVNNDTENALALPNGQIFVFCGMLELCSNDDQLAAILSHEMAHCILGHGAEGFSMAHLLDCAMVILITIIWVVLPSDSLSVFVHWLTKQLKDVMLKLPYDRKIETEADEVGMKLAAKACYDVRESSAFWSKVDVLAKAYGDTQNIEFLSTHPSHENRSQYLDSLMDDALKFRMECGCCMLQTPDPRLEIKMMIKLLEEEIKKYKTKESYVSVIYD